MDKFWEWMRDHEEGNLIYRTNKVAGTPKQMLIGYMIEYCFEKRIQCNININYYNYEPVYEFLERGIDCFSKGKQETEEIIEESSQKELTQDYIEAMLNSVQFGEAQSKNPEDWENHECEYDSDGGACKICKKTVTETILPSAGCPVCKSLYIKAKRSEIAQGIEVVDYWICQECGNLFADVGWE